jgi:hypothetical protein
MEAHMYTFLNQKYGLKKLTFEWASAIIDAIAKYKDRDNEICVFQNILKNQCDEEFRFVQAQVRSTIIEILRNVVRAKYPLKSNGEVNVIVREK